MSREIPMTPIRAQYAAAAHDRVVAALLLVLPAILDQMLEEEAEQAASADLRGETTRAGEAA